MTNRFRSLAAGAFALLASLLPAAAQTPSGSACPYIAYGAILTAAQWNYCFQIKQDTLNYTPVNKAGDGMQGLLTTIASTTSQAGFRIYPGVAPTVPTNGDLWTTSAGLYVRINGTTIGPLSGATSSSFAATSPILVTFPAGVVTYAFDFTVANVFTARQTVSLNAATLPSALTGTAIRASQVDGTIARVEVDSFGTSAPGVVSIVYGRGTGAAPTAVQSGDELGSLNMWGYTGAATLSGTAVAAFRAYAAETFSSGHQGSKACLATTAIAGTTLTDSLCQQSTGGVTIGGGTIGTDMLEVTGTSTLNGAVSVVGGSFGLSGNISAPAWTTNGIRYKNVSATLTDTTSSGTVATAYSDRFGGNTIAASSATTFTNYFSAYVIAPTNGTNVTFTNAWALGADSLSVGTSNPVKITTGGVLTATSPVFTTPSLGVATGTSLALNGCTIGANALCASGTTALSSSSAAAFGVGLNGSTNPAFNVDASTASQAAGLNVKGAATGGTVAISAIDSGAATNLSIDGKGTGTITIAGTSTGNITLSRATGISAATTITSSSASALAVGLNGSTNPALQIDASTASSATGLKVKSAAAAAGLAVSVITSGTNENLTIDAAGSGTITLGGTSTGAIIHTRASTFSAAITYGGVTLSNAVTGTGNMVLSAGSTLTGTTTTATLVATTLNGNTFTTGTYTLTGVAGKTLTFNNSITLAGTDATTMTFPSVSATIPRVVASGTLALSTSAISSGTCTAAQTAVATGTLTTDAFEVTFNADPTGVTGYTPVTTGGLTIWPYPTADTFNAKVCNPTGASITPGAITLNFRVIR